MTTPRISIIMPVYNGEKYLNETIASLQRQTFGDFELICVDDGSTDGSAQLLADLREHEERLVLIRQKNAGAGAARNRGFEEARGQYVMFLDSDDLFSPKLLEKMYQAVTEQDADMAACNFISFDGQGNEKKLEGIYAKWIPKGRKVFSYRDCPDYITRLINPVPWNKMYRADFIRRNGLRFEEISSTNDVTFSAVSAAVAERITYVPESLVRYRTGHAGTISSGKESKLNNVVTAVRSAMNQVRGLPHGQLLRRDIACFAVGNYLYSLKNYVRDFSSPQAERFYRLVHDTFQEPGFDEILPEMLHSPLQYQEFCTVRKHDYEAVKDLIGRRLIVSMTTYPGRIHLIPQVLETIYKQTRKADEIVLWLAQSQFPGLEEDLPAEVTELVQENRLTLRWCEDLKAHKKYFYALQEYRDDLVVTIDDDLRYSPNMLSSLYASYLCYPDAVSTVRAHLMMFDENGQILPYGSWIQETDSCMYKPSMQLIATGGAGVLHPPGLYRPEFFDAAAVRENCLWADDLWLKAMQAVSGVPVVVARQFELLKYLPDSQEEGLVVYNVHQRQNDVQMQNIIRWLDETFEPGILMRKLTQWDGGEEILGIQAVSAHLDRERKNARRMYLQTDTKLKQTEYLRKRSEERLAQTQDELKQHKQELRGANNEVRKLQAQTERQQAQNAQLRDQLAQLRENNTLFREQNAQLRQENGQLRSQKTQAENRLHQSEEKRNQLQLQLQQSQQKQKQTEERLRQERENAPVGRQLKAVGKLLAEQRSAGGNRIALGFKYLIYGLAWIPEKLLAGMMFYLKNGGKETAKHVRNRIFRKR